MHLVVDFAVGLDLDVYRREEARDRGRREDHVAEEFDRLRIVIVAGDGAHVPHDRALGVEVRRANGEQAPALVFACNFLQEIAVDVLRHQRAQRTGVGEGLTAE